MTHTDIWILTWCALCLGPGELVDLSVVLQVVFDWNLTQMSNWVISIVSFFEQKLWSILRSLLTVMHIRSGDDVLRLRLNLWFMVIIFDGHFPWNDKKSLVTIPIKAHYNQHYFQWSRRFFPTIVCRYQYDIHLNCKGLFTPSESGSESERDQLWCVKKDQRKISLKRFLRITHTHSTKHRSTIKEPESLFCFVRPLLQRTWQ